MGLDQRPLKGIDIFAKEGTTVVSPTGGLVLFDGHIAMGGNVVLIIGAKWRLHYFAHLQDKQTNTVGFIDAGTVIGKVGTTGNATDKSPHLHYLGHLYTLGSSSGNAKKTESRRNFEAMSRPVEKLQQRVCVFG